MMMQMASTFPISQRPLPFSPLLPSHPLAPSSINFSFTICCPSETIAGGNSQLLGLVNSWEASIGIQISPSIADPEKFPDMVFSIDFVKKLMKQSNKLQFDTTPKANSFVEKIDKD